MHSPRLVNKLENSKRRGAIALRLCARASVCCAQLGERTKSFLFFAACRINARKLEIYARRRQLHCEVTASTSGRAASLKCQLHSRPVTSYDIHAYILAVLANLATVLWETSTAENTGLSSAGRRAGMFLRGDAQPARIPQQVTHTFQTYRMQRFRHMQRLFRTAAGDYSNAPVRSYAGVQRDLVNKQTSDQPAAHLRRTASDRRTATDAAQTSPALDKLPGRCLRISAILQRL